MIKNVIVSVDNKEEPQKITVQEAKDRVKAFSPYDNWKENTYYKERNEIISNLKHSSMHTGFDLNDLIAFLQGVRSDFGNMPVLYFSGEKECFRKFELHDIDIVKRYFTILGNAKNNCMEIKNEKALSFFHI